MKRKHIFIFRSIVNDNRRLLYVSIAQIPLLIILPYIKILLTKTLVAGIEKQCELHRYVTEVVCIFLLQLALMSMKEWMAAAAEWNNKLMVNSLLKPLDQKTMYTNYSNVEGEVGQKLRQKALNAAYFVGQSAMAKFVSFAVNLGGLVFYGMTVGKMSTVILLIIAITTCAGYFITKLFSKYEMKQKEDIVACDKKMQYLENEGTSLQAAREIRLYDMSGILTNLFIDSKNELIKIKDKIFRVKILLNSGESLLSFLRNFCIYIYLIYLVAQKQIIVADFVLLTGVVSGLSGWLSGLMTDMSEIRKINVYLEDYFCYLDLDDNEDRTTEQFGHKNAQIMKRAPELEFIQVGFRYEGAKEDTLKDINLFIKSGEKLAIVGRNGAGKTTLIKLLTGLYRPSSGKVLLDGVDITQYSKEEYYRAISTVFQDIILLPVDIGQNVSSATLEKTDLQKVKKCLEKAELYKKILQFPQGMNTPMQKAARSDGVDLSGGEQQKVMIAKALYKDANILILDEPTAALDPIAENSIYQKYNELSQGMTSLFISHRLASTNFCDNIILINDGKIEEQGNHKELMELHGEYWKMFTMQSHYYLEEQDFEY